MATLRYAGIGARATPAAVLADMETIAAWLARDRLDSVFRRSGRGRRRVRSGRAGGAADGLAAVAGLQRASRAGLPGAVDGGDGGVHRDRGAPASGVGAVFAGRPEAACQERGVLLGETLDRPVDAVVCWTARGCIEGGTGMAIRIAEARGIPVLNLGSMTPRAVCERLTAIRRSASAS